MKRVPLWFPFLLALLFALFGTACFPSIRLIAFAPFLAILYNRCSFVKSLWIASLCGLIIDLVCSQLLFGLHALNYTLTTAALYKQKHHFFEDKPIGICVFTALISSFSTLIQLLLSTTFEGGISLTWNLIASDVLWMPCLDALYAYLGFCLVIKGYHALARFDIRAFYRRVKSYLLHLSKNVAKSE